MLNEDALPLYIQLQNEIEGKIKGELWLPGDKIPSEQALSTEYRISRATVRQAINNLVDKGLLEKRRGIGTFVLHSKFEKGLTKLIGFTEDMIQRGHEPSSIILKKELRYPDYSIAKPLKLSESQQVFMLERLRLADGIPIALERSYIPVHLCPNIMNQELHHVSLYEIFEKVYHLPLVTATQSIAPGLAENKDATLLKIIKGSLLLCAERLTYTRNMIPVELSVTKYRSDRYKFTVTLHK